MRRRLFNLGMFLILVLGGALTRAPAPVLAADIYFVRYFPETQHNLQLPFLKAYDDWGGLPVFGYPISEMQLEQSSDDSVWRAAQWLERERLEVHPQNTWPYRVLLGLLGVEVLQSQGRNWQTFPRADPSSPHYIAETGHAIAPQFWDYWRSHGLDFGDPGVSFRESLALFGYPISEPALETNSSGDHVLTQWFQRARFELHPGSSWPVQLGLLGNELTAARTAEAAFQPASQLDIPHAAARRRALADAQEAGWPIPYRDDIQSLADQAAEAWTTAFNNNGDDRAVLRQLTNDLRAYPPAGQAVYAGTGFDVQPRCKGVDPFDPMGKPIAGPEYRAYMKAMTLGVTHVYQDQCGPAVSFVLVGIY